MINAFAQALLGCIVFSVIFLGLAGYSLIYVVAKFDIPKDIVQIFLQNLRFPIDRIWVFFPTGTPEGVAEYVSKVEPQNALVLYYVSRVIIISIVLLMGYGLYLQNDTNGRIAVAILFSFCVVSAYFTWRFGHKLKDFDAKF